MMRAQRSISDWLQQMPLVAILRGLEPERAAAYGFALADAGICIIEVPLNGPRAFDAVGALAGGLGRRVLVGAGTVLTSDDARRAHNAGARLIVSPNSNPTVIEATTSLGMISIPGFSSPSEAFSAIEAGASALKLFPAEGASPRVLSAILTVLRDVPVLPVGGITPHSMAEWWQAGAAGFGIGSALFRPGLAVEEVARRAKEFADHARQLRK